MWGNLLTEVSYQPNFNITFSNNRSDVLIHLTQWQYWWWFWFAFVWVLYYFIVARVVRHRIIKFRPRIVSSFRPHGKWGDLLICLIPVSWCANILINSNFLLKLIEWQSESSLFTIRIRARQWYWIYKFDLKNVTDVVSVPKNVGNNKWVISNFGDFKTSNDYIHALQLRSQNKWVKKYWSDVTSKFNKPKKFNIVSSLEFTNSDKMVEKNGVFNDVFLTKNDYKYNNFATTSSLSNNFFLKTLSDKKLNIFKNKILNFNVNENIMHPEFIENTRWVKRSLGKNAILRVVKLPVFDDANHDLFKLRFHETSSKLEHKIIPNTTYLTIKQKRYKRRKIIPMISKSYIENDKTVKFNGNLFLKDNSIIVEHLENATRQYRMMRKNKMRNENIPVVYSKRLLRVKRTLVLPAHVNITAITNSYDIVHSWFIPGLGLKMDCIPGRSTHHTFYIDNVGFYYGQCAEICGRYHHHMPIRVCALPFEHFLVWWHSFGVNKLIFTNNQKRFETNFAFRKFVW